MFPAMFGTPQSKYWRVRFSKDGRISKGPLLSDCGISRDRDRTS